METPTTPSSGFLGSIRAFGDDVLASVHRRIELLALEVQEEKLRLIQAYVWISAAMFTGALALMFGSLTLVYVFWESARLAVLGGLTLFYAAAMLVIVVAFRRYLRRQPKPFEATLEELKEDRACIREDI
ncbi:MAG: phage holin family protein [Opitutae bacterium]|nr:phage holin family protein [Opitutae bacterium]